jgi:hypothetical protein
MKTCPICGITNRGTVTSHMRTHDNHNCEIVGECSVCGKQLSFFGVNSVEASKNGEEAGWICDECKGEVKR